MATFDLGNPVDKIRFSLSTEQSGLAFDTQLLAEKQAQRAELVANGASTAAVDARIAQLETDIADAKEAIASYNQELAVAIDNQDFKM